MTLLNQIMTMKVLIIPIAAWFMAQSLKTVIHSLRERHLSLRHMASPGGMPSAHATLVCALATTVGIAYGIGSGLFAIAVVLSLIVMYDAISVRQAVDKQSTVLSHLLTSFPKTQLEFEHRLEQLVGHTRFQVLVGAILGILLALWLA